MNPAPGHYFDSFLFNYDLYDYFRVIMVRTNEVRIKFNLSALSLNAYD